MPNAEIVDVKILKGGIINKTFLVQIKESNKKFILQQINHSVFQDIPALMANLKLITGHLQKKASKLKGLSTFLTYKYYHLPNGENYYLHTDNTYWRLSDYLEHESNIDKKNPQIVFESGKLYGYFIRLLRDIDLRSIHETISAFHDSEKYYRNFTFAVKNDKAKHLKNSQHIYASLYAYRYLVEDYQKLKNAERLPLRLVHNDTKIDNILFNRKNKALSVIDLDTCMPGYLPVDFGDAIRSLANTGKEDDLDLNKVSFDFNLYREFTKGFMSSVRSFIEPAEKEALPFFALLITYEQALRFYADYLNGDIYYHTEYPDHNLQRTKTQLKLLNEMSAQYSKMQAILKNFD